jgi:hypothetical protein
MFIAVKRDEIAKNVWKFCVIEIAAFEKCYLFIYDLINDVSS